MHRKKRWTMHEYGSALKKRVPTLETCQPFEVSSIHWDSGPGCTDHCGYWWAWYHVLFVCWFTSVPAFKALPIQGPSLSCMHTHMWANRFRHPRYTVHRSKSKAAAVNSSCIWLDASAVWSTIFHLSLSIFQGNPQKWFKETAKIFSMYGQALDRSQITYQHIYRV